MYLVFILNKYYNKYQKYQKFWKNHNGCAAEINAVTKRDRSTILGTLRTEGRNKHTRKQGQRDAITMTEI